MGTSTNSARGRGDSDRRGRHHPEGAQGGPRKHVPEFDVAAVGIVATMIAGGGMLLTRRRETSIPSESSTTSGPTRAPPHARDSPGDG